MLEKSYENIISEVVPHSIAERVGIEKGDVLLSINGEKIEDIIEYMFFIADEALEVQIKKIDGKIACLKIRKEYDEDLGIVFENPIIDKAKSCRNKCIFCFIDQLPPRMRETLYFKDDDSRLSFLQGNFVTLTNMSEEDLDKIIQYRISPINVSIHTTDPELRVKMLNNKTAGNVYERLKKLTAAGIKINGQIVLCPKVNDGKNLDRTIKDLSKLFPCLESLAVVPVGITSFREKLVPLETFNRDMAYEVVSQIEKWQQKLWKEIGTRFVFLSDEFYMVSGKPLPSDEDYEDFPQIENGVGLMARFKQEFFQKLREIEDVENVSKKMSIVTGTSAREFMTGLCEKLKEKVPKVDFEVHAIQNHFFGTTITVAGLVTGQDIIRQLKDKDLGERLIIPESMMKAGERIFLDDTLIEDLEKELNIQVIVSPVDGKVFIDRILE